MMDEKQKRKERGARWLYLWLFFSPFITVPWMAINLWSAGYRSSTSAYVAAVLWPALIHLFVLPWTLKSPSLYVRRHTQQAFLLVGLRALSAVLFIGLTRGDAACLWFLANGSLWLGGSIWGWRQIKRGDCWLMRRKGEGDELPRPWAEGADKDETLPAPSAPAGWGGTLAQGRDFVREGQQQEAVACFLEVFRRGTADLRQQATMELEQLGEVEAF